MTNFNCSLTITPGRIVMHQGVPEIDNSDLAVISPNFPERAGGLMNAANAQQGTAWLTRKGILTSRQLDARPCLLRGIAKQCGNRALDSPCPNRAQRESRGDHRQPEDVREQPLLFAAGGGPGSYALLSWPGDSLLFPDQRAGPERCWSNRTTG